MRRLVDLTPTRPGGSAVRPEHEISRAFETACEYVESIGDRPFTRPELFMACHSAPAANQLLRFFTALAFIERVSDQGARPVFYRVLPHALPKRDKA